MILSDEEREKFCCYLRRQIASGKAIVEQMEALPMGEALAKREKERLLGWSIVLQDLEATESFSVSGEGIDT